MPRRRERDTGLSEAIFNVLAAAGDWVPREAIVRAVYAFVPPETAARAIRRARPRARPIPPQMELLIGVGKVVSAYLDHGRDYATVESRRDGGRSAQYRLSREAVPCVVCGALSLPRGLWSLRYYCSDDCINQRRAERFRAVRKVS